MTCIGLVIIFMSYMFIKSYEIRGSTDSIPKEVYIIFLIGVFMVFGGAAMWA